MKKEQSNVFSFFCSFWRSDHQQVKHNIKWYQQLFLPLLSLFSVSSCLGFFSFCRFFFFQLHVMSCLKLRKDSSVFKIHHIMGPCYRLWSLDVVRAQKLLKLQHKVIYHNSRSGHRRSTVVQSHAWSLVFLSKRK